MIALFLTLTVFAPVPQDSASPARLHPAGAILYAETPDTADVLIAYEDAPIAKMIRDPEVRSSIEELVASSEYDVQGMISNAAAQYGIPAGLLAAPLDVLTGYLAGVDSVSLSVTLHESSEGELEALVARMLKTFHRLSLLREHLTTYSSQNQLRYPPDLTSLVTEEELLKDGWGNAYDYRISSNSSSYELRSLGADGVLGGRGENTDLNTNSSLKNALAEEGLAHVGATVIVEFSSGATASQTHGLLTMLAGEAGLRAMPGGAGAQGASDSPASKGELTRYQVAVLPQTGVWTLLHDSRLIVGAGASSPEGYFARLDGTARSAASSSVHAQLFDRLPAGAGATLARGYVSIEELARPAEELAAVLGEEWNAIAGAFSAGVWRMQLDGERFVTDTIVTLRSPGTDWKPSLGCEPLSEEIKTMIPADSVVVGTTSIDAGLFYKEIMGSLGDAAWKDSVPSALTEMEERYGFSLETDVFGSVGSGAAFYMLPVTGVMTVPGMALLVELEDPEAFQKGLEGVLALLGERGEGEYVIKHRPYRDRPMWYFTFNQAGGSPIPISPSLVIFDNYLLVTLTNLRAKKEIKRLGLEPGERHQLFGSDLPEGAASAGFMDWPALTNGVYGAGRALLSLMGGGMELPFDVSALPEAETFTQFFEPTVGWSKHEGDEIRMRVESSFGPATLAGLTAIGGAAAVMGQELVSPATPPAPHAQKRLEIVSIEAETDSEVGAQAEAPKPPSTNESLGFLSTRLAIYKLEMGRYPAALNDLAKATENYPRGFLGEQVLPPDEWGQALSYTVAEDGQAFQLWSIGPDGIDQQGSGDDLVPR